MGENNTFSIKEADMNRIADEMMILQTSPQSAPRRLRGLVKFRVRGGRTTEKSCYAKC